MNKSFISHSTNVVSLHPCFKAKPGKLAEAKAMFPRFVATPAGFEGFFEEIGAMSPPQQQEISRVMEIGKKYGLEILPPPGV